MLFQTEVLASLSQYLSSNWLTIGAAATVILLAIALFWLALRVRTLRFQVAAHDAAKFALTQTIRTAGLVRAKQNQIRTTAADSAAHQRIKIYVDHSTFARDWEGSSETPPDWAALSKSIINALQRLPAIGSAPILYCGTNVYGSYYQEQYYDLLLRIHSGTMRDHALPFRPNRKARLRDGLLVQMSPEGQDRDAWVETQITSAITAEIEQWRAENFLTKALLTTELNQIFGYMSFPIERRTPRRLWQADFNGDGIPLAAEKRVDTQLSTDLVADAFSDVYDIAILVANDADFIPAIGVVKNELDKIVVQIGRAEFSKAIRSHVTAFVDLGQIQTLPADNTRTTSTSPTPPPQDVSQVKRPIQNEQALPSSNLSVGEEYSCSVRKIMGLNVWVWVDTSSARIAGQISRHDLSDSATMINLRALKNAYVKGRKLRAKVLRIDESGQPRLSTVGVQQPTGVEQPRADDEEHPK